MEEDLPRIHKLMKGVVLNGKSVDLKSLNQALESQLNKLLKHSDNFSWYCE